MSLVLTRRVVWQGFRSVFGECCTSGNLDMLKWLLNVKGCSPTAGVCVVFLYFWKIIMGRAVCCALEDVLHVH